MFHWETAAIAKLPPQKEKHDLCEKTNNNQKNALNNSVLVVT